MVTITDLAKAHGARTLFEQVSLQLTHDGKYGVVGANGSGKSSLLRIIAGEEEASSNTPTEVVAPSAVAVTFVIFGDAALL